MDSQADQPLRRLRRHLHASAGRRFGALLLAASLLAACTPGSTVAAEPPNTVHVLAGSELKDLVPLLPQIRHDTGVNVVLDYSGTLEGAERIAAGDPHDLAWFSSSKYIDLLPELSGKIKNETPVMLSPVVLGVKRSVAESLGWEASAPSWADIAAASAAGRFKFAMTDPSASNSGFSTLVGVASALSGKGEALEPADVTAITDKLRAFFTGQVVTAGSSGYLADSYVRDQSQVDGLFNYESVLLSLNHGGKLREQLDLVYPKEGIVTADYPLLLLRPQARAQYNKLTTYLRSDRIQRQIMTTTFRRPVSAAVPVDSSFPSQVLIELPFPGNLETINDLLDSYLNEVRRPSHPVFVLDLSGSMQGDRIDRLKKAFDALTGLDNSLTGRFARFRNREQITIVTFSDRVEAIRDFTIDSNDPNGSSMTSLRSYIDSLQAGGGTAIFSAMSAAFDVVRTSVILDPNRFYSVVLMTDGENNEGISADDFLRHYRSLPKAARAPAFTILFGEANPDQLHQIATATGGAVFDARTASLTDVFKQVSGYE